MSLIVAKTLLILTNFWLWESLLLKWWVQIFLFASLWLFFWPFYLHFLDFSFRFISPFQTSLGKLALRSLIIFTYIYNFCTNKISIFLHIRPVWYHSWLLVGFQQTLTSLSPAHLGSPDFSTGLAAIRSKEKIPPLSECVLKHQITTTFCLSCKEDKSSQQSL